MEILGDTVVIRSSGAAAMLARGIQGERRVAVQDITSVQVKLGTMFVPGYINVSYPGGMQFQGGVFAATQDPDTLIFNRSINSDVEKFAAEIDRRRVHSKQPNTGNQVTASVADELRKLLELHRAGALSDAEFATAKQKALSR